MSPQEEAEEADDDWFSSPSSVATPTLRSKEVAEMSQLGAAGAQGSGERVKLS